MKGGILASAPLGPRLKPWAVHEAVAVHEGFSFFPRLKPWAVHEGVAPVTERTSAALGDRRLS